MLKKYLFIFIIFLNNFSSLQAEGLKWEEVKTIAYDIKSLPNKRIFFSSDSPDKKYKLISYKDKLSSENNLSLYLIDQGKYKLIDDYQEIKNVKWNKTSSVVYFEAIKSISFNEISYWKVNYLPRLNIVYAQVLKIEK